jgi:hypothetical protein
VRAEAYRLVLWKLVCQPQPRWDQIERMLAPANRPAELSSASRAELLPPPGECRAALLQWAEEALEEHRQIEERLVGEVDGPQLAFVVNQGAIPTDEERAKPFQRASSEYRTLLFRSLNTLIALRKAEAAATDELPSPDGNDPRGSAGDAVNAGARAGAAAHAPEAPPAPRPQPQRIKPGKGAIDTPVRVVERPAEGVESAPGGEPQVTAGPKVEGRAEAGNGETQNEPTRGVVSPAAAPGSAGGDSRPGGSLLAPSAAGPEVSVSSQPGAWETCGQPDGGVGRPATINGQPDGGVGRSAPSNGAATFTRPADDPSEALAPGGAATLTWPAGTPDEDPGCAGRIGNPMSKIPAAPGESGLAAFSLSQGARDGPSPHTQ